MLVHVFVNNVPVVALIDSGSDVLKLNVGGTGRESPPLAKCTYGYSVEFCKRVKGGGHASGYECQC